MLKVPPKIALISEYNAAGVKPSISNIHVHQINTWISHSLIYLTWVMWRHFTLECYMVCDVDNKVVIHGDFQVTDFPPVGHHQIDSRTSHSQSYVHVLPFRTGAGIPIEIEVCVSSFALCELLSDCCQEVIIWSSSYSYDITVSQSACGNGVQVVLFMFFVCCRYTACLFAHLFIPLHLSPCLSINYYGFFCGKTSLSYHLFRVISISWLYN